MSKSRTHQEWRERRKTTVGGTDAATILGVNPYQTVEELFAEKMDELKPQPPRPLDPLMRFGQMAEPFLAQQTTQATGLELNPQPGMFINRSRRWQSGNPDAITDTGAIVEFKTFMDGTPEAADWMLGHPTDHALIQTSHYLSVTGYEKSIITAGLTDPTTGWERTKSATWDPAAIVRQTVTIGPIGRDLELEQIIIDAEQRFLDCLERGRLDDVFPPIILTPADAPTIHTPRLEDTHR